MLNFLKPFYSTIVGNKVYIYCVQKLDCGHMYSCPIWPNPSLGFYNHPPGKGKLLIPSPPGSAFGKIFPTPAEKWGDKKLFTFSFSEFLSIDNKKTQVGVKSWNFWYICKIVIGLLTPAYSACCAHWLIPCYTLQFRTSILKRKLARHEHSPLYCW